MSVEGLILRTMRVPFERWMYLIQCICPDMGSMPFTVEAVLHVLCMIFCRANRSRKSRVAPDAGGVCLFDKGEKRPGLEGAEARREDMLVKEVR